MKHDVLIHEDYEGDVLKWDTDYFGVASARLILKGIVNTTGQTEILDYCQQFKFVTINNVGNRSENNHWIGNKTRAFLTDVNIQFLKLLADVQVDEVEGTYVVNNLSRNERIIDISKQAFNYSRFFNDPNLPSVKAQKIYLHWAESAFHQPNKYFVVSEREGKVAGYLLFSFDDDTSVIELIAVDEQYQGQRVGKSLIQAMESFLLKQEIKKIKVGTQINNVSAVRFYTAMGFKYENCTSIYHLWEK